MAYPRAAEGAVPRRAFAALCIVAFLNSFFVSPFSALFPVYVEADLGRLPLFTANLRALMLVLGGVFAVVAGRLCDRIGRKNTLLIGLAGSVLTGLVFRTGEPALLALLVWGMGMASGPWSTAGQSYLIASVTPGRLGLGGALYFLSNTAGNSLGSLLTGRLKEGWTFPEIGDAMLLALGALFVVAVFALPTDPKAPLNARRAGGSYWPLLRRRDVHLLVGLRALVTTFWGMATLLMPLLVFRVGESAPLAAYFASVSLAVAAAGQLAVGYLSDRVGVFRPLMVSGGGVVLSALALAFWADSLPGLFAAGTALTAAAWAVSTLIPKLIDAVAGPDEKNRLVGLGHFVWSAAMVGGSVLGGLLVEIDAALPFYLGAALASGGTLCGWRLCRSLDRQVG